MDISLIDLEGKIIDNNKEAANAIAKYLGTLETKVNQAQ